MKGKKAKVRRTTDLVGAFFLNTHQVQEHRLRIFNTVALLTFLCGRRN
jgi:hypothetical protein